MLDSDDAIAVVGLAARIPGARDVEEFWLNLVRGRSPAPAVTGFDDFAAALFGGSPDEAVEYDRPTKVFLEVAHSAIENAGYDPARLTHRAGVFAALPRPDAVRRLLPNAELTTCPGALAAQHLACQSLQARDCDLALVIDGTCAVLLKRLPDAHADHDHIRALIRGNTSTVPADISYVERLDGGLAGFLTAVLALEREQLPPSGFATWTRVPGRPRRAACGGSTEYVVLEEAAPEPGHTNHAEQPRVLVWSALTVADERAFRQRLAQFFVWRGEQVYADTVATLQHTRARHPVRAAAVCTGALDAATVLGAADCRVLTLGRPVQSPRPMSLLFPDANAEYVGMARALYRDVPTLARAVDGWFDLLGIDHSTVGEPLVFAVQVVLAQLWQEAGVHPQALLGHGIGELSAATVAGLYTPGEAAALVIARTRGEYDLGVTGRPPTVPVHSAPPEQLDALLATGEGVLAVGDAVSLLTAAARLWTEGHDIAWERVGQPLLRHRVPLPEYPYRDGPMPGAAVTVAVPRKQQEASPDWLEVITQDAPGPMMVAIPYAGGSSRVFRPLQRYLPPDCGLALVDLPGHGCRMGEPCLSDPDMVVDELLDALLALPAQRLILLGYSLGGSFGYDLAGRLTEAGAPPDGLVVCGTRAPQVGVGHPPVAHLPPGEPFLRAAVDMGLAAPEMLELPALAESFAGPLQADLSMVESFRYRPRPPLEVPLCVVGFRRDWLVPEPSLRAWDAVSRHPPLHLRIDGGHLAMHEREAEFGEAIAAAVEHVIGRCLSKEGVP